MNNWTSKLVHYHNGKYQQGGNIFFYMYMDVESFYACKYEFTRPKSPILLLIQNCGCSC